MLWAITAAQFLILARAAVLLLELAAALLVISIQIALLATRLIATFKMAAAVA